MGPGPIVNLDIPFFVILCARHIGRRHTKRYLVPDVRLTDRTSLLLAIPVSTCGPCGCIVTGTSDIKERVTIDKKERKNKLVAYGLARAYARFIGL